MPRDDVWLMPGMDGTGRLFGPLLAALSSGVVARVVEYPRHLAGYDELLSHTGVPAAPVCLVAESFSGPLALRLAARAPDRVRAIVLVASFVRGPRSPLAFGPALDLLLAARPPRFALRAALLGADAPAALVDELRDAIASVPAATIAARVREAARTDAREDLRSLRQPLVWVRASRDRLVSAQATRDARAVRPDLDVRVVSGPHLLAQTRPREIAQIIDEVAR